MCLAIPMQVLASDGRTARCGAKGIERDVSLFLLDQGSVRVGDYVLVHVGYAIALVQPEAARSAWELYDRMLAAEQGSADA